MPIQPDNLTSLINAKTLLGIPLADTTRDGLINFLIPAASRLITEWTNRSHFLSTNSANPITEFLSGTDDPVLVLRQWPVQGVTSVYEDDLGFWGAAAGSFATQTLLTAGTDYVVVLDSADGTGSRSGTLLRLNGVWRGRWARPAGMLSPLPTSGRGNIKVTYTVGFSTIPADLDWACATVVARMVNGSKYGRSPSSEGYEEFNYGLGDDPNPALGVLGGDCAATLARYRILPIGMVTA